MYVNTVLWEYLGLVDLVNRMGDGVDFSSSENILKCLTKANGVSGKGSDSATQNCANHP